MILSPTTNDLDYQSLVNWDDPLCQGLACWYLNLPGRWGGARGYCLTTGRTMTRTNMTSPSSSSSGQGTTIRQGGWGEDRYLKTHPDYIQVATSQMLFNQAALTIAAWVNPQDNIGYRHVYSEDGAGGVQFFLRLNETGKIEFGIFDGTAFPIATGATTVPPDTWSYIAGTKQGTTLACWLNGRVDGTATFSGYSATPINNVQIGRITNAGSELGFFGAIDDVTLSTRAIDLMALLEDGRTFHPRMLRRVGVPMIMTPGSSFQPAWAARANQAPRGGGVLV